MSSTILYNTNLYKKLVPVEFNSDDYVRISTRALSDDSILLSTGKYFTTKSNSFLNRFRRKSLTGLYGYGSFYDLPDKVSEIYVGDTNGITTITDHNNKLSCGILSENSNVSVVDIDTSGYTCRSFAFFTHIDGISKTPYEFYAHLKSTIESLDSDFKYSIGVDPKFLKFSNIDLKTFVELYLR